MQTLSLHLRAPRRKFRSLKIWFIMSPGNVAVHNVLVNQCDKIPSQNVPVDQFEESAVHNALVSHLMFDDFHRKLPNWSHTCFIPFTMIMWDWDIWWEKVYKYVTTVIEILKDLVGLQMLNLHPRNLERERKREREREKERKREKSITVCL